MNHIHENTKPFYYSGNNIGCLLIHGFTGSPAEMRPLGEYLQTKGYTVKGVLLKGHGTKVEDMEKTTWKDWLSSAEKALLELMKKCDRVVIIGLSMGGIISLNLSSRYNVDGVISLASPIYVSNRKAYYAAFLKYFQKYEYKKKKETAKEIEDNLISYDKTPVAAVAHLMKLIRITKRRLKKIKVPIFIMQSKDDNTVVFSSAEYILNKVKSPTRKLIYLKESGHVITTGAEKNKVFYEVEKFLDEIGL